MKAITEQPESNVGDEWKCTGCLVTGTWEYWESFIGKGEHMCDACFVEGIKDAKLVKTGFKIERLRN